MQKAGEDVSFLSSSPALEVHSAHVKPVKTRPLPYVVSMLCPHSRASSPTRSLSAHLRFRTTLPGNRPNLRWLDNLCAQQEAVVLVVVGDDDAALLFASQHKLNVVLDVGSRLVEGSVDVLHREVDDGEAVLQLADDCAYLFIRLMLLIDGNELRHAERRDVEPFAHYGVEVVQAVAVGLVAGIAAVGPDEHVSIHEYVVGVVCLDLSCHSRRSEYQMWELLFLLGGEQVEVARHPHAYLCVHEFFVLQSRLLKEQLQHGLALLLHLFLFLAHNAVVFDDYGGKGTKII